MRIAEIVSDYRNIQRYLAAIRVQPLEDESSEEGYVVLRRCIAEAQQLLAQPFQAQKDSKGSDVVELRRVLTDAAVRRFKAQKLYLRATAALRWINSRVAILQGRKPHAGHSPALQQIRNILRAELASITDQRVELSLRSPDTAAGKWQLEDPSLSTIQRLAGNGGGRRG